MPCPFCNLEITHRELEERSLVRVIFSDPRLMPGHLLVIPKRHVEHVSDLDGEERKELFDTAIEYQQRIVNHFGGCDLSQHDRPFVSQSRLKIDHVHIHLKPRQSFDAYWEATKGEMDLFSALDNVEMTHILEILKKIV